jgi:hypothetical protein
MRNVWKKLFLTIWICGILFPAAWASQKWPTTAALFQRFFGTETPHILAHIFLFTVLGCAAYLVIPGARQHWWIALLLILLIALMQESVQVFAFGGSISNEELFDLRVDITSGLAGIFLGAYYARTRLQPVQ